MGSVGLECTMDPSPPDSNRRTSSPDLRDPDPRPPGHACAAPDPSPRSLGPSPYLGITDPDPTTPGSGLEDLEPSLGSEVPSPSPKVPDPRHEPPDIDPNPGILGSVTFVALEGGRTCPHLRPATSQDWGIRTSLEWMHLVYP